MGFIVIVPFAALAGWSIFAIARWLRRGGYDRQWWKAFALLAAAGLVLGIRFTFFFDYTVANVHMHGFPIPLDFANREKPDSPWVSANLPADIRVGAMLTDLLAIVAICLAPIAVAAFVKENKGKLVGPSPTPNNPP